MDLSENQSAVAIWRTICSPLEATGDYAGAKKMLDTLGVIRAPEQKTIDSLHGVPVDIAPDFRYRDASWPEICIHESVRLLGPVGGCPMHAQDPAVLANIDEAFRLAGRAKPYSKSLPSHVTEMTSAAVAQYPTGAAPAARAGGQGSQPQIPAIPTSSTGQLRVYFAKHYDAGPYGHLPRPGADAGLSHDASPGGSRELGCGQAARRRFENTLQSDPPVEKANSYHAASG